LKLLVVGVGDCGCRLAAEFVHLQRRARAERNVNIVAGAYAINNNQASLAELAAIEAEFWHPILIGRDYASSDVSKLNEFGAKLARDERDRIMAAIRATPDFFETDAFLLIAGAAGGVGSGGISVIAQMLRQRYVGRPVYAVVTLPFESEELNSECVCNTAICLKSVYKVADAVFLVDNERFKAGDGASPQKLGESNRKVVDIFYDLLCASGAVDSKYVGTRNLGIGDVIQTLAGWTAIGVARAELTSARFSFGKSVDFQKKGGGVVKALEAMNAALSALSVDCRLEDAGRVLYLLSAPIREASLDMTRVIGNRLSELSRGSDIRGADFPGERNGIQVSALISELAYVEKVKSYYDRAAALISERGK